jgi:hypothetical protein
MRTAVLCAVFWCSLGPVRASASTAPSAVEESAGLTAIGGGLCALVLLRRRSPSVGGIQSWSRPTSARYAGATLVRKWFF